MMGQYPGKRRRVFRVVFDVSKSSWRQLGLWLLAAMMVLAFCGVGFAASSSGKADNPPGQMKKQWVEGEILVKFKKHVGAKDKANFHAAMGTVVAHEIQQLGVQRIKGKKNESMRELLDRYATSPHVEYAEPNYIVQALTVPNDPSFSELWGLNNTGQTVNGITGTPDADIDAPEAWNVTTGSRSVVVAVIDTGVNSANPELSANIWTNPGEIPDNGIDDDGNGYVDDVHGWDFLNNDNDPTDDVEHGTHVAGTIGGLGNNGAGLSGVNWQVTLMPLKFLGPAGGSTYDAVRAILYASQMGAQISNNSWGGGDYSETLRAAIVTANERGHLFVAAAGNDYENNDVKSKYPCTYQEANVVCVGATDANDIKAGFSNYGAASVHLSAPGVNIYSTLPGGGYDYWAGTSMATPHVTGTAALMLSKLPSLNVQQRKSILWRN